MKYFYYPGCIAETSAAEADIATREVARALDIELIESPASSCCGAGNLARVNPLLDLITNARNISLAEKERADIVTICNTCLLTLKNARDKFMKNPDMKTRTNSVLSGINAKYQGDVDIKHFLWVIVKDLGLASLKKRVQNPLTGLKIAPFYGCQILRPSEIMQFENPDDPQSLENLITTLGGIPVQHEGRTKCCGFPLFLVNRQASLKMLSLRFQEIKEKGADCIVTPCTLCHLALDTLQNDAWWIAPRGRRFELPVFHVSQLTAMALGVDIKKLEFERHFVNVKSIMKRIRD